MTSKAISVKANTDCPQEIVQFHQLPVGSLVLGDISRYDAKKESLIVALPDGLMGTVPRKYINNDDADLSTLSKSFIGRTLMFAVVQSLSTKKITLTCQPSVVNAPAGKLREKKSAMYPVLNGTVISYERSGILIDLGFTNIKGLIPTTYMASANSTNLPPGSILMVQGMKMKGSTLLCSITKKDFEEITWSSLSTKDSKDETKKSKNILKMPQMVGQLCDAVVTSLLFRDRMGKPRKVNGTKVAPAQSRFIGATVMIGSETGWITRHQLFHPFFNEDGTVSDTDLTSEIAVSVGDVIKLRSIVVFPKTLSNNVRTLFSHLPHILKLNDLELYPRLSNWPLRNVIKGDYVKFKPIYIDGLRITGEITSENEKNTTYLGFLPKWEISDKQTYNLENLEYIYQKGLILDGRIIHVDTFTGMLEITTKNSMMMSTNFPFPAQEDKDKISRTAFKKRKTLKEDEVVDADGEIQKRIEAANEHWKNHRNKLLRSQTRLTQRRDIRLTNQPHLVGETSLTSNIIDVPENEIENCTLDEAQDLFLQLAPIGTQLKGVIERYFSNQAQIELKGFSSRVVGELALCEMFDSPNRGTNVQTLYPQGTEIDVMVIGKAVFAKAHIKRFLALTAKPSMLTGTAKRSEAIDHAIGTIIPFGVVTGHSNGCIYVSADARYKARILYRRLRQDKTTPDEAKELFPYGTVVENLIVVNSDSETMSLELALDMQKDEALENGEETKLSLDTKAEIHTKRMRPQSLDQSQEETDKESELSKSESYEDSSSTSDSSIDEDKDNKVATPKKNTMTERRIAQLKRTADSRMEEEIGTDITMETAQTPDQFEKLAIIHGEKSEFWIRYMASQLTRSNVNAARAVFQKALENVPLAKENDRLDMWTSAFAMEVNYGNDKSMNEIYESAIRRTSKPANFMLKAADILRDSKSEHKAQTVLQSICKKHPHNLKVLRQALTKHYAMVSDHNKSASKKKKKLDVRSQNLNQSRLLASDCVLGLKEFKKDSESLAATIAKLEFDVDEKETGSSNFDRILSVSPKRTDIWIQYLDCIIKAYSIPKIPVNEARKSGLLKIRSIFVRATDQNVSMQKVKQIYKKWLQFEKDASEKLEIGNEGLKMVQEKARRYLAAKKISLTQ